MQTYHIHINGIVQGVGFRPMIYLLAKQMQLNGYVTNGNNGVHIFFNASEQTARLFFRRMLQQAPTQSKIISSGMLLSAHENFSDFSIVIEDDDSLDKQVLISPDTAVCAACKSELHDIRNRRYRYPFITCTQCGPRYSIIDSLPYERHGTSMKKFSMCQNCNDEYNNVEDRRFFSQTNSCADCGIQLCMWENASSVLSGNSEKVLSNIKQLLRYGKIIALKGIGGYLLLCDAGNDASIQLLRNRKHRPSKPLALLYPDTNSVRNDFELNKDEEEVLQSKEAPIVLLYPKQTVYNTIAVKKIAPGLKRLGVMLPYSPLLQLIAGDYATPLVATSANISGSPIIYEDEAAREYLFDIADYVVSYNRNIVVPQDDSVIQISKYAGRQIILRRSRGYAPSFLWYTPQTKAHLFSTGAFLKSSFTLSANENIFVSQFLGTGETYESQQMYKDTAEHWLQLYKIQPHVIITDMHPQYFSHQYAIELAENYQAGLKYVQHHEAHFAAVLAENKLLHSTDAVLGIIWDGSGLGSDGNIWGGEFFRYEHNAMQRCYHLGYFPAIAGDRMALEPRIAALCMWNDTEESCELKSKFSETEWNNYRSLLKTTRLFSSSVGRIFDAVGSLLDVCDRQTYEGEAAMYLQALAEDYVIENGFSMDNSYFPEIPHDGSIPVICLIQTIISDVKKGSSKNYVAAKFHYSLICLIDVIATRMKVTKICCSGGVFQNALLTDWIEEKFGDKYQVYFHKNLSPNDENISFGQLVYYDHNIQSCVPQEEFI